MNLIEDLKAREWDKMLVATTSSIYGKVMKNYNSMLKTNGLMSPKQLDEEIAIMNEYVKVYIDYFGDGDDLFWLKLGERSYMRRFERLIYYWSKIGILNSMNVSSDVILDDLYNTIIPKGEGGYGIVGVANDPGPRGKDVALKMFRLKNNSDHRHLIHEGFIAMMLNQLSLYKILNFVNVYGYVSKCDNPVRTNIQLKSGCDSKLGKKKGPNTYIVMENLPNSTGLTATLSQYISAIDSDEIQSELFDIYFQIFAALAMAQKEFEFVHGDLHTSNILIQRYSEPRTIIYQIGNRKYSLETSIIATIIDYGTSRISLSGKVYKSYSFFGISDIDNYDGRFLDKFDTYKLLTESMYVILYYLKNVPDKMDSRPSKFLHTLYGYCVSGAHTSLNENQLIEVTKKRYDYIQVERRGRSSKLDYYLNGPIQMLQAMEMFSDYQRVRIENTYYTMNQLPTHKVDLGDSKYTIRSMIDYLIIGTLNNELLVEILDNPESNRQFFEIYNIDMDKKDEKCINLLSQDYNDVSMYLSKILENYTKNPSGYSSKELMKKFNDSLNNFKISFMEARTIANWLDEVPMILMNDYPNVSKKYSNKEEYNLALNKFNYLKKKLLDLVNILNEVKDRIKPNIQANEEYLILSYTNVLGYDKVIATDTLNIR